MSIWEKTLKGFQQEMRDKIQDNLGEKGTSWRDIGNEDFLKEKLKEYLDAEKWTDAANICFMIWERKLIEVAVLLKKFDVDFQDKSASGTVNREH